LSFFRFPRDFFRYFQCRVCAVEVVGFDPAFLDYRRDCSFEMFGHFDLPEPVEHQLHRKQHGGRVDLVLTRVLRRRSASIAYGGLSKMTLGRTVVPVVCRIDFAYRAHFGHFFVHMREKSRHSRHHEESVHHHWGHTEIAQYRT
jgi:hypothetical protein